MTRLGFHSKAVVTGDLTQTDLPGGRRSGLSEAIEVLKDIPAIGMAQLSSRDVVRHELVQQIVDAYDGVRPSVQRRMPDAAEKAWRKNSAESGDTEAWPSGYAARMPSARWWSLVGAVLVFGLFCAVKCSRAVQPDGWASISHQTITATKDVVDEITTESRRQAAADAVEPTYHFQEGAIGTR